MGTRGLRLLPGALEHSATPMLCPFASHPSCSLNLRVQPLSGAACLDARWHRGFAAAASAITHVPLPHMGSSRVEALLLGKKSS